MQQAQQPYKATTFRAALPQVALVSSVFLLTYLARSVFGPMLGSIEEEYSISHSQATHLLLFISIGYALSLFTSGFTCSWLKPRTMVALSLMACGITLLLIPLTSNFTLFQGLFVILGATAGHYFNAGLSTLRTLVQDKDWGKAISVHELGPNLSFVLGPALAGFSAAYIGWRAVISCLGILCIAVSFFFYCRGKGGMIDSQPISLNGAHRVVTDPYLWLFMWVFALGIAGEFAPYSVLGLYLEKELLYSTTETSFWLTVSRVAPPFAILFGGHIVSRFGTNKTLIFCFATFCLSMFLLATPWKTSMLVGMFVQPMATAISFPAIFTLLAENFAHKDQPMLFALSIPPASIIGGGLIPKMLGFFGDYSSFTTGFTIMGILVALTVILLLVVMKTRRRVV